MSKHVRHLFIDALENNLKSNKAYFEEHLQACFACAQEFQRLKQVFEQTQHVSRPEPSEAYWDSYWLKLQSRLDTPQASSRLKEWFSHRSLEDYLRLGLAAAAVFIVSLGLYFGHLSFRVTDITDEPIAKIETIQNTAQAYLERSKILLTSFSNINIETETTPRIPNFEQQKKLSQELVAQTSSLKEELSAAEQNRALSLINDLEVVLLQIANMDSAYDMNTLEMIQYSVEQRSILFKLNLQDIEAMSQDSQKGEEI